MLKKPSNRSIRSKGIKVKHILQIVLLVGVCFWLIYQVKHSHDKKKEFAQKDNEITTKTQDGGDGTLKLGRKDLHPHVEEVRPGEKQEEDEEEETGGEEEDSKHEEFEGHEELKNEALEEEDEGSKHEGETDDDGRGGGDDDIDENDQEKVDNESDREGENVDDERLKEDTDEEAGAGNEEKDKEEQREHENSFDEPDNDVGEESTHEAREENYKGDDASSAVAHDDHSTSSETEDSNLENSNENLELKSKEQNSESSDTEEFKRTHNSSRLTEEVDKMDGNGTSTHENMSDVKLNENTSLSTDGSVQNSILTTQSIEQPEPNNNSSSAITETNKVENTDSFPLNGTEIGLNHAQDETIDNLTAQNETSLQSLILTNLNDTVSENNNSESKPNTTTTSTDENSNGVEGENIITSKTDLTVTDDKTTEPEKDEKTNEPEKDEKTTEPEKDEKTTEPKKDEKTTEPEIDEKTTEPEKDEKTTETEKGDKTTEPENVLPIMITQENSETSQNEKSEDNGEDNGESDGDSSDSTNHTEDPVQEDPIDSDDSHVTERVDLDTLPDIRTEVDHSEESAAE